MKNISMKKVLAILVIALIIVSISSVCFASGMVSVDITPSKGEVGNKIENVSGIILGVAQVIGVAVAVIMLVVLAIKYISAAPAEKGEIKKSAFMYIIGALLLFGGVAVLNVIQSAGESLVHETAMVVYYNK